jgi:co-chaperonin GroES (HSP10)
MNAFNVKPLGDKILLHKCENDDVRGDDGEVLVALPDKTKDNTMFCQVLAVGPKCKNEWPVGATVRLNYDFHQDLIAVPGGDGEVWVAREGIVEPVVYA